MVSRRLYRVIRKQSRPLNVISYERNRILAHDNQILCFHQESGMRTGTDVGGHGSVGGHGLSHQHRQISLNEIHNPIQ